MQLFQMLQNSLTLSSLSSNHEWHEGIIITSTGREILDQQAKREKEGFEEEGKLLLNSSLVFFQTYQRTHTWKQPWCRCWFPEARWVALTACSWKPLHLSLQQALLVACSCAPEISRKLRNCSEGCWDTGTSSMPRAVDAPSMVTRLDEALSSLTWC